MELEEQHEVLDNIDSLQLKKVVLLMDDSLLWLLQKHIELAQITLLLLHHEQLPLSQNLTGLIFVKTLTT